MNGMEGPEIRLQPTPLGGIVGAPQPSGAA